MRLTPPGNVGTISILGGSYTKNLDGSVDSSDTTTIDALVAAGWQLQDSPRIKLTAEGGLAVLLVNGTGTRSIKGTVVEPSSSVDGAVVPCTADDPDPIGFVYDSGVPNGGDLWVVVAGVADALLADTTAATRGNWVRVSATVAGRADATSAAPPGGGITEIDRHFREVGHCLESKLAGVGVLARLVIHFN